jgi:hypothetical protein
MTWAPHNFLNRPLGELLDDLRRRPAADTWAAGQGRVEWHSTAGLTRDAVAARAADLLTVAFDATDADLPPEHPDVDLPGVVLEGLLGEGGQGWVYAGRVTDTGKLVAVKVLRGDGGGAVREAELCRRVRHPHVLRVFGVEPAGACRVVVMELVRGRDLATVGLPAASEADCLARLADAVRAVGRACVVHRDVKPANVLLREAGGGPVLVDFGLATDCAAPKSSSTVVSGTPVFMAPEAWRDGAVPEPSWDAYALGVTAAVLLTGVPPAADLAALHHDKRTGAFDCRLRDALTGVADVRLAAWAAALIDRDPARRLATLGAA